MRMKYLAKYFQNVLIKRDEIGGVRSTHKKRNTYKVLIQKREAKRSLHRSWFTWGDNIKIIKETRRKGVYCIQERDQWPVFCEHKITDIRVPENTRKILNRLCKNSILKVLSSTQLVKT
jgi:hypothetical protein